MWIKLIVFIVVIGFSAFQSLMKAAQDKARQEQLRGQNRQAQVGGPNRKRAAQNEIEAFLQDVTGADQGRQQAEAERARLRRERRREQIDAKRIAAERKQRQQQEKKKPRSSVHSSIGSHVDQYIKKHVNEYLDHDVDEYVEATIVDSVEGNLGNRASEMPASTKRKRQPSAASSIVALLRNPAGLRNAIIVNEILSRPKILRK